MNEGTTTPRTIPGPLVQRTVDARVAIVTIDEPGARHVTLQPELVAKLDTLFASIERDDGIDAVVLRSAKPASFCAGMNLGVVQDLRFASDAEELALDLSRVLIRVARSRKPTVACVDGCALGGGFELALACTAIVATDTRDTVFGLPDIKLGLIPGGNGLLRVAERAGLRIAAELGLRGHRLHVHDAWKRGLVDEIVEPDIALSAARELALRLSRNPSLGRTLAKARLARARVHGARRRSLGRATSWRAKSRAANRLERALVEENPLGRMLFWKRLRADVQRRTLGTDAAAVAVVDVLERYGSRGFASAARLEARLFGDLVVGPASRRLVELFFATLASKKELGLPAAERQAVLDARPASVESLGVVGAGLMGAGIAASSVRAGLVVHMRDADDTHLRRGLRFVRETIDTLVARDALTLVARERAFDRLHGTTNIADFRHVGVAIEAVYEDLALKHQVLRELEAVVDDDCVLASNTSSVPIAKIAEAARRPERVLGMHYFRPAWAVPLVEVVRTTSTSARALATAIELGKRQRKHVLVVRDGPGFYTTRTMAPMLAEAVRMVSEGVAVDRVDEAVCAWGFSAGPLRIFDEIGVDLALRIAEVLHEGFGARAELPEAFEALRRDDRRGRKNARGFYLYPTRYDRHGAAKRRPDPTVYEAIASVADKEISTEDVALRCALAFVNEAVRCLSDGVLPSPRDGDIGAVLGLGFPAFRGGPFRTVDTMGAREVLRHLRNLEGRFGPRFEPAPLLVDMARHGKRFYD